MGSETDQGILPFDLVTDPRKGDATPPFDVSLLALSSIEGLGRKSLVVLVKMFGDNRGSVATPVLLFAVLHWGRIHLVPLAAEGQRLGAPHQGLDKAVVESVGRLGEVSSTVPPS